MGSVYKHGRVYWIKYYDHGKAIRESTRTERWLRRQLEGLGK